MSGLTIRNARVLTETGFLDRCSVTIEGPGIGRISDAAGSDPTGGDVYDARGLLLLPGFIDLQVNGGGGVLFNDAPTVDTIRTMAACHRRFGTTGFLPTLISDELDVVERGISAVREAIAAGVPGVVGIHIEGPFLNAAKKGVHDASRIRAIDEDAVDLLSSLESGRTLVTVAPEQVPERLLERLCDAGVVVAAGHTAATYAEARAALETGLRGFTHLYNAMSPLTGREPGAVGAALEDPNAWCSLIVDGHHVHPAALRIAIASKPAGRCLLVTDAMPVVGTDGESFQLQGRRIRVADGRCITDDGVLAGSSLDMAGAVRNAHRMLHLDLEEAVRMASAYPADAIGLGKSYGRIAAGCRADLVLADESLNVLAAWIGGIQVLGAE